MTNAPRNSKLTQQNPLQDNLRKTFDLNFLQQVIDNSSDAIFVTDEFANVLLVNAGMKIFMGYNPDEMIGINAIDLVREGVYDWSPTIKAIKARSVVSGNVTNNRGVQFMVTSKPLIDKNGDIVMVITNAQNKEVFEDYITALEKERTTVKRYKTAVEYLSDVDLENKKIVARESTNASNNENK